MLDRIGEQHVGQGRGKDGQGDQGCEHACVGLGHKKMPKVEDQEQGQEKYGADQVLPCDDVHGVVMFGELLEKDGVDHRGKYRQEQQDHALGLKGKAQVGPEKHDQYTTERNQYPDNIQYADLFPDQQPGGYWCEYRNGGDDHRADRGRRKFQSEILPEEIKKRIEKSRREQQEVVLPADLLEAPRECEDQEEEYA